MFLSLSMAKIEHQIILLVRNKSTQITHKHTQDSDVVVAGVPAVDNALSIEVILPSLM